MLGVTVAMGCRSLDGEVAAAAQRGATSLVFPNSCVLLGTSGTGSRQGEGCWVMPVGCMELSVMGWMEAAMSFRSYRWRTSVWKGKEISLGELGI